MQIISFKYLFSLKKLHVVGLVGSIDNDFCGTDMTIGADSALHRISECINNIQTTAYSHQRVFVLEVMGRHCGYLALSSAIACGADYVFLPEAPPSAGWEEQLKNQLQLSREVGGRRTGIVIVSEGAIDKEGRKITTDYIKTILSDEYDTRVTILGHVQRGGNTSAYDRILSTRMGIEAAKALTEASNDDDLAQVIVVKQNKIIRASMMDLVRRTKMAQQALADKDFEKLEGLRGMNFRANFRMFKRLTKINLNRNFEGKIKKRIAIMATGAPCSGMNSVLRTAVLSLINHPDEKYYYEPLVISDGFEGLMNGDIQVWDDLQVVLSNM